MATGTRLVTTAGAVPLDEEGNLVGLGDVRAQARQTLHNLMRQLAAAGAGARMSSRRRSTLPRPIAPIWTHVGKRSSGRPSPPRPARCLVSRYSAMRGSWSRSRRSPSCPSGPSRLMRWAAALYGCHSEPVLCVCVTTPCLPGQRGGICNARPDGLARVQLALSGKEPDLSGSR